MYFTTATNEAYDQGIEPAISDAGYKPMRVDREHPTGKIDDFIVAELRKSRFLVADMTGHRQNVYFEVGYALARNPGDLDLPEG